jgi:transcriptional regulator with XRE-family HTH domain
MAKNRIFEIRKTAKLSQRELAERAGTSQQQIQRVEAGIVAVRLDLAKRIADALQVKLADVFPGLGVSAKIKKRKAQTVDDPELAVDLDPRVWTARFFMFDGRMFDFEISSFDMGRLESIIESSKKKFLVFNSRDKTVAINNAKIAACQFLFDPPFIRTEESETKSYTLRCHLVSAISPLLFDIKPDTKLPEQDDGGLESQAQRLFIDLDGAEDEEVVDFYDADDERVWIRTSELVLMEAPLEYCEPSLFEKSMQGDDEDDETQQVERSRSQATKQKL